MSILYTTIIYKETKVLVDYTEYYGNIQQTTSNIMKNIKKRNFKGTICFENKYSFHYLDEKEITYICLSDKNYPLEVAHYYLKQLKELLFQNFRIEQIKLADSHGLEQVLKPKIKQKQDFFNQDETGVNQIRKNLLIEFANKSSLGATSEQNHPRSN